MLATFQYLYIPSSQWNPIIKIEESNQYYWQQYMNEDEFNKLKEGMSYMEVVEVARGAGEKEANQHFIWRDELLMTQIYEIHFEDNQLVSKEIKELKGYSTRGE